MAEEAKDRTKDAPTRKRDVVHSESVFEEWWNVVKKVTTPTGKEWFNIFWRVSLILLIAGVVLFLVDYLLLEGVLKLQSILTPLGIGWLEVAYTVLIFLTGLVAGVSVLSTTGGTEGGLSSMLGSSVQYGDVTGSFSRNVSKTIFISSGLLMLLTLFAPVFLGGI